MMKRRIAATQPDRMELAGEDFHAAVENAYHELISRDPRRYVVVNALGDREKIAEEIAGKVLKRLTEAET